MNGEDYKSHNNYIMPASRDHGYGEWNGLFGMLLAWGLIDRDGRRNNNCATAEQLTTLAAALNTSDSTIKSMLQNQGTTFAGMLQTLQMAGCEQTSSLKDAIHASSTENLVGQNALGEKVTTVGYRGDSNAKDIEKTVLIDGGVTRKNDDDNTNEIRNAQNFNFSNIQNKLCDLGYQTQLGFERTNANVDSKTCEIKGEIKDTKYELSSLAERHFQAITSQNDKNFCELKYQAQLNHQATTNQISTVEKDEIIRDLTSDNQRLKEKNETLRYNDLKEEITDNKREINENQALIMKALENERCHRERVNEINVNSKNIASDVNQIVDSAVNNAINVRINPILDRLDRLTIAIGNSVNIGHGNIAV